MFTSLDLCMNKAPGRSNFPSSVWSPNPSSKLCSYAAVPSTSGSKGNKVPTTAVRDGLLSTPYPLREEARLLEAGLGGGTPGVWPVANDLCTEKVFAVPKRGLGRAIGRPPGLGRLTGLFSFFQGVVAWEASLSHLERT